ncbi:MAG: YbhB/YbcL family Raf kinase inhibitor-like protein [Lautropia sp.]|nr:YbhB/YbcL family Raf kinase inhibitor-like protein [Lautropia sp.]
MSRFLRPLSLLCLSLIATHGMAAEPEHFRLRLDELKSGRFTRAHLASSDIDPACKGHNQSPAISWVNAPAGARSFVLVFTDKGVPKGSDGSRWAVVNIPGSVTQLPGHVGADGSRLPEGALQTRTGAGKPGYMGVCPSAKRPTPYEFRVWALKTERLDGVTAETPAADVARLAEAQSLGVARLTIIDHQGVGYRTGTKLER